MALSKMRLGNFVLEGDRIGKGGFGLVRRCRQIGLKDGPLLVGKLVFQGDPVGREDEKRRHEEACREVVFLTKCRHRNIAELVDLVVEGGMVLFVMHYERYGDLHQVLFETLERNLSEHETAYTFRQVLDAVRYLHDHGVVHRDLKTQNILVASLTSAGPFVKVTDFGLSKMCNDNGSHSLHTRPGTECFMAPEVYNKEYSKQGFAVDIFSLGILLFFMLTREFPGKKSEDAQAHCPCLSTQEQLDADIEQCMPPLLRDVAQGQLRLDPSTRLMMGPIEALDALNKHYGNLMHSIDVASSSRSASGSAMPSPSKRDLSTLYDLTQEDDSSEVIRLREENTAFRQQLQEADFAYAQLLQNKEIETRELENRDEGYARALHTKEQEKESAWKNRGFEFVDIALRTAAATGLVDVALRAGFLQSAGRMRKRHKR